MQILPTGWMEDRVPVLVIFGSGCAASTILPVNWSYISPVPYKFKLYILYQRVIPLFLWQKCLPFEIHYQLSSCINTVSCFPGLRCQ